MTANESKRILCSHYLAQAAHALFSLAESLVEKDGKPNCAPPDEPVACESEPETAAIEREAPCETPAAVNTEKWAKDDHYYVKAVGRPCGSGTVREFLSAEGAEGGVWPLTDFYEKFRDWQARNGYKILTQKGMRYLLHCNGIKIIDLTQRQGYVRRYVRVVEGYHPF